MVEFKYIVNPKLKPMKTLSHESRNRAGGNLAKTNELLRLQRTNEDIAQLSNKLNSYTCEPCTYSLFEQAQALKERMANLLTANNEIISSVKQHRQTFDDIADVARQQVRDFNELSKSVLDYARTVQSHH